MADEIFLNVFGCPTVHHADGREIRFRTQKQLGLFVYLALETRDRAVSRDVLVELFWSDTDPRHGRHSLSQAFSTIRERFGPDSLTRGSGPVQLRVPVVTELEQIDAHHVPCNRLLRPLDDLESAGSNDFSHWVDSIRTALSQRAKLSLESALADAAGTGSVDRVREHAAQLYRVDPLSRPAVAALTDELLEQGDRTGAIQLLQQYRDRFSETIGNAPPGIDHRLDRIRSEMGSRVSTHDPDFSTPVEFFVGRNEEVAELEVHWAETQQGQVTAVAVHGNPGIGKSTLLRRFVESVRERAWPSFFVSCPEIGEHIPYGATSELIRALMRDPGMSGTDPMWLAEASRVSPGLRSKYSGIPEAPTVPPEAVRLRVAEALSRMIDAVAENGPVLIAIDDLHQMDPTSRDVLHLLIRRRAGKSTMLLCSARTPALRGLAANDEDPLAAVEWTKRIALGRLPDADTHDIITRLSTAAQAPPSTVRSEIVRMAEGNPYLTAMLISDWQQDPETSLVTAELRGDDTSADWNPPDRMRQAFARQHRGLSQEAERLVDLLAVAGRSLPMEEARTVLGIDRHASDSAALELVSRSLVRFVDGGLTYKSQLNRRFVYSTMDHDKRRYLHNQIAESLVGLLDDSTGHLEASHHFLFAGNSARALDYAVIGARQAILHGAPAEAEAALEKLRKAGESQLRYVSELAAAKAAQGKFQAALEVLGAHEFTHSGSEETATALLLRAEVLHRSRMGSDAQIADFARDATAAVQTSGTETEKLRAIQLTAEVAADRGDQTSLEIARGSAKRIGESSNSRHVSALAKLTNAYCLMMMGHYLEASNSFAGLVQEFDQLSLELDLRRGVNGHGVVLTALGRFDEAARCFRRAAALALTIGDTEAHANAWSNLGALYHDVGAFEKAHDAYGRALHQLEEGISPRRSAEININAASFAIAMGDAGSAERLIRQAMIFAQAAQLWRLDVDVLLLETDHYLALHENEIAWTRFEEAEVDRKGRSYPLGDIGRHERLIRHFLWHNEGPESVRRYSEKHPLDQRCLHIADHLEVKLTEAWLLDRDGALAKPILGEVLSRGLSGILAYLLEVGVIPTNIPSRQTDETSVQLAFRSFLGVRSPTVPQLPVFAQRVV